MDDTERFFCVAQLIALWLDWVMTDSGELVYFNGTEKPSGTVVNL